MALTFPDLYSNTLRLNHIIWPREQAFVSDWLLSGFTCVSSADRGEVRRVEGGGEGRMRCGAREGDEEDKKMGDDWRGRKV